MGGIDSGISDHIGETQKTLSLFLDVVFEKVKLSAVLLRLCIVF